MSTTILDTWSNKVVDSIVKVGILNAHKQESIMPTTLDNQNAFMDKFMALAGVSEAYASGIWHSLSDRDKYNPIRSANAKAYAFTHNPTEIAFKRELDELCKKHGVLLISTFDDDTDTAIRAVFKDKDKDLHSDVYTFTIDE